MTLLVKLLLVWLVLGIAAALVFGAAAFVFRGEDHD